MTSITTSSKINGITVGHFHRTSTITLHGMRRVHKRCKNVLLALWSQLITLTLLDKVMSRHQWHIPTGQRHLVLIDDYTRP